MCLKSLREKMDRAGMDAFYVSAMNNVFYLSGFFGTAGILFVTKEQTYLVTDFRYITQAKLQAPGCKIIDNVSGEEKIFSQLIKEHDIKSVGFERDYVTYSRFIKLEKLFKGCRLLAAANMVEESRAVKSPDEMETIRKACEIADIAFENIQPKIRSGMTELQVAAMLEYEMKMKGATEPSFETIVASGKRSAMPHGTASTKVIEKGDFVVLDFGCKFNGYCSDITRTVVVGEPSDKQRNIYEKVLKVQLGSLENVKSEAKCSEIDLKSREMFKEWGIDEYFGHSLGHGVGLDIHENPRLSSRSPDILKENMIVTVEPGIYIPDEFGVRIEDTVAVEKNGARRLTTSTKELRICR